MSDLLLSYLTRVSVIASGCCVGEGREKGISL
jgi:hypothetical protein